MENIDYWSEKQKYITFQFLEYKNVKLKKTEFSAYTTQYKNYFIEIQVIIDYNISKQLKNFWYFKLYNLNNNEILYEKLEVKNENEYTKIKETIIKKAIELLLTLTKNNT